MGRKKQQRPKSGFRPSVQLDARQLLRQLSNDARRLEEQQRAAVKAAREQGAPWSDIAKMTGMASKQAAYYRYGRPPSSTKPAKGQQGPSTTQQ